MTLLRCEKMLEIIIESGEIQNEPLSEEIKKILSETMKKIRYIDNRILPREFGSDHHLHEQQDDRSDSDLGILGESFNDHNAYSGYIANGNDQYKNYQNG
jgi:hypothetical protein